MLLSFTSSCTHKFDTFFLSSSKYTFQQLSFIQRVRLLYSYRISLISNLFIIFDCCLNVLIFVGTPIIDTRIQIPVLDDNAYPSAIAVPLKEHPLFSLMSECAVNIVPKYYILAMRCLSSANYTNKDIIYFNKQLHRWIIATVYIISL